MANNLDYITKPRPDAIGVRCAEKRITLDKKEL